MKLFFTIIAFGLLQSLAAQTIELKGVIKGTDDLDGVHVINNKSQSYTTTNVSGEFKIKGKLNDTLLFSSILYKLKKVVITPKDIKNKYVTVVLETFVNELNEVVLGRVLTGDLISDVKNMGNKKQITFADVGIPGYQGKPLTQSERRLKEAGEFKPTMGAGFGGAGVGLGLNPIINAITGRTKMLKQRVKIERKMALLKKVKQTFAASFFDQHPLPKNKHEEFFLYCSNQADFMTTCNELNLKAFDFLRKHYQLYLQRLNQK